MAADLIARDELPEAFVCVSDEVALALMDALRDAGVDVPGRVAVTGFDGLVAGRLVTPELTTVRQPMAAMGALVVRDLIDRVERAARANDVSPVARTAGAAGKLRLRSRRLGTRRLIELVRSLEQDGTRWACSAQSLIHTDHRGKALVVDGHAANQVRLHPEESVVRQGRSVRHSQRPDHAANVDAEPLRVVDAVEE